MMPRWSVLQRISHLCSGLNGPSTWIDGSVRRRAKLHAPGLRTSAIVDSLEDRQLLTAVTMTDNEQLLLELINRARANPSAEATRYGIDLNAGLPAGTITTAAKQPLSPHQSLINAAGLHSQDMLDKDYFAHNNLAGKTPAQRATDAGYPTDQVGENIAWGGSTGSIDQVAQVFARHQSLFNSPGHRQNMMHPPYEEVGNGIRYGVYRDGNTDYNAAMVTENFGIRSVNPFITGVVYTDSNSNSFYDVGEAIRSGTITAYNTTSQQVFTQAIGNSGGYGVSVPAGTYSVSARYNLGQTPVIVVKTVTVGTDNVKVDFLTGSATPVDLTMSASTTTINEIGGTTTSLFTITRSGDLGTAVTFTLASSDTSEATVPATVVIPVGQASATFTATAVNDQIADGNKTVGITVASAGYPSRTVNLSVVDKSVPVLPSQPQTTNSYRPTFTWQGVQGASSYEIWISRASGSQEVILVQAGINGTSFSPSFDMGIGTYRVWVRARSGNVNGPWSVPQTWRIATPPTVANDGSKVGSTNFTISWNAIQGAVAYDIWVDNLTNGTSQFYRNTNVGGTSVNVSNFSLGRYGIWVRGRNANGEWGNYSARAVVTVSINPSGIDVTASNFNDTPVISWLSVPGAAAYEIWVDSATISPYFQDRNVAGLVRSLPGIIAGGYKVWVRAKDSLGVGYGWSSVFNFEYQKTPTPLGPSGAGQSSTPVFTWTAASGVQRYELWVSSLAGTGRVIHETNLTGESYVPASNLAAGTYRIWIRAFDSLGTTYGWSRSLDFTVADSSASDSLPSDSLPSDSLPSDSLPSDSFNGLNSLLSAEQPAIPAVFIDARSNSRSLDEVSIMNQEYEAPDVNETRISQLPPIAGAGTLQELATDEFFQLLSRTGEFH